MTNEYGQEVDANGEVVAEQVTGQTYNVPPRRNAGYEQYINVNQLAPEIYPNTPVLDNIDYFPNADQAIQIGTSPSAGYSQGAYPIFSGEGNLFPINTYTKRARALETAAYQNQLAKLRKEQNATAGIQNLFKTPDFKDPFYSQQLYNVTNEHVAKTKDKLSALAGGSNQEIYRILQNPRTPEEQEVVMEWHRGMGQIKSMNNVANYLADVAAKVADAKDDKSKVVLPEMDNLISSYRSGKFPLGSPELSSFPQRLGIVNNVNEELNTIVSTIKADTKDEGGRRKTFKSEADVKKYLEAYIGDNLDTWSVGAGKYKNGKGASKQELVDYYAPKILAALGKGDELNAVGIERAKSKGGLAFGNTTPDGKTNYFVEDKPSTVDEVYDNLTKKFGLLTQGIDKGQLKDVLSKEGEYGKRKLIYFNRTDVPENKIFDMMDAEGDAVKARPVGYIETNDGWDVIVSQENKSKNAEGIQETAIEIAIVPYNQFNKRIINEFSGLTPEYALEHGNADTKTKGAVGLPKTNITQADYAKLKTGDKYFYNGQEYTKQ